MDAKTARLHKTTERRLPSGDSLLFIEMESPISYISVWAPVGSRFDPEGKEGLAHLLEHLLMKTTTSLKTSREVNEHRRKLGVLANAATSHEVMRFHCTALSSDVVRVVEDFAHTLSTMAFDEKHLAAEKKIISDERSRGMKQPDKVCQVLTNAAQFAGSRMAHWGVGTEDSIEAVQLSDLHEAAKVWFADAPKTFVVCGPADPEQIVAALSNLAAVSKQKPHIDDSAGHVLPLTIQKEAAPTVQVALSYRTCGMATKADLPALRLLAHSYLAAGSASRIGAVMREERNLTYGVRGGMHEMSDVGYFTIRYSVKREDLKEANAICEREIKAVADGQVDEEMLLASKKDIRFKKMSSALEPQNVGEWYGRQATLGMPIETMDDYCDAIDQVTSQDLARVAKTYLSPANRSVVLLGDASEQDLG